MFERLAKPTIFLLVLTVISTYGFGQVPSTAEATKSEEKRAENIPSGINDSFLDPNMNVEQFIKRFEVESREVFACRAQILEAIQLKPGMAVADVGSGTGLYLRPLSRSVGDDGKVYAIDIAPKFVKHLRDRANDEMLGNVEVVLCSDRDINLKGNSIDRAFLCDVYHHFEYPEGSLKSIYRAMRTGGKLILVDFHRAPDVSPERKQWLQGHIRAPLETFKQEIIDAGFRFDEQVAIDGFSENYLLRFTK
ncbi:MAG: class I SAM-dependent methyltransferase [Pirellula sp.]|jgi:ubiquinone/menaquinone biosynthesis C-methylase UbiE|nr:methyltransferase domain-containing protein [Pirellula sp.]